MQPATSRRSLSRILPCLVVLLAGAELHAQQPDRLGVPVSPRHAEGGAGIASCQDFPQEDRAPLGDEPVRPDPRVEGAWLAQPASIPGEPPPKPDLAKLGAFALDRAYHGTQSDGTPSVRGSTYRACFSDQGASFTPFLGSDAPRGWPVQFRLADISIGGDHVSYDASARALRDDDRLSYARGSVTERYEIGVDSIEQVFVFDTLSARGEIVVRLGVETDLSAGETPSGIEFSNERGGVRYGRATALDASGASIPAETTLFGNEIEIRVPAEFVAKAELPLVIDPVISTFSANLALPDLTVRDCAYDATYGRWLIICGDSFNLSQDFVLWRLAGVLNGQTVASGFMGDGYWEHPRCANNNTTNKFLVVAEHGSNVIGQSISAANGALGAEFMIAQAGYGSAPDVGGDPYSGSTSYFLVMWINQSGSSGATEVQYRTVGTSATVGPIQVLQSGTGGRIEEVAVSNSNGASIWNVAWTAVIGQPHHRSLCAARIAWNGNPLGVVAPLFLDGSSAKGISVSPALSGTNSWLVAFQKRPAASTLGEDVGVALFDGLTLVDEENVSLMIERAGGGSPAGDQRYPALDSDGRSFAMTFTDWSSHPNGGNAGWGALRVATLSPIANQIQVSEVATIDYGDSWPAAVASTWGAGLPWRLHLAAYSHVSGGDAVGALYDNALFTSFCHPGYDGIASCPCGNAPSAFGRGCNNSSNTGGAALYATGISSVSSDSMSLIALNLPTNQTVSFYQGTTPLTTAAFSGQGIRCVGGTQVLLYTKPSFPLGTQSYSTAPNPGDPSISVRSAQLGMPILAGQTRYYYASYRTTGTSGGGSGVLSCTNPFAGNVTQSVQALWIP